MPTVTYRPPDIYHWFSTGSQEAIESAKRQGRDFTKSASDSSVKDTIKKAASVAAEIGRGAGADIVHRQANETAYKLHDKEMSVKGAVTTTTLTYNTISSILAHPKDKFSVEHEGGTLIIRPIAHLVSGRIRVAVGWERNGIEVPFTMLLEELSARSGVEILPA